MGGAIKMKSTLVEIAGAALVMAGLAMIYLPLAFIVSGAAIIAASYFLGERR